MFGNRDSETQQVLSIYNVKPFLAPMGSHTIYYLVESVPITTNTVKSARVYRLYITKIPKDKRCIRLGGDPHIYGVSTI